MCKFGDLFLSLDVRCKEERERERVEKWKGMKNFPCKFGDLFLSLDVRCKEERETGREREREREKEFNVIFVLYFLCVL